MLSNWIYWSETTKIVVKSSLDRLRKSPRKSSPCTRWRRRHGFCESKSAAAQLRGKTVYQGWHTSHHALTILPSNLFDPILHTLIPCCFGTVSVSLFCMIVQYQQVATTTESILPVTQSQRLETWFRRCTHPYIAGNLQRFRCTIIIYGCCEIAIVRANLRAIQRSSGCPTCRGSCRYRAVVFGELNELGPPLWSPL